MKRLPLMIQLGVVSLVTGVMAGVPPAIGKGYDLAPEATEARTLRPAGDRSRGDLLRDDGGPDDFGYRWVDSFNAHGPRFEWIDARSFPGQQTLDLGDDGNSGPLELGFTFRFYDQAYDYVYMCSNGWASFTSDDDLYHNDNYHLPGGAVENMLAVAFSDWNPDGGGVTYFWSDTERAVLGWENVPHIADNQAIWSFQIVLYRNGWIQFQYRDVWRRDDDIVVGIQNYNRRIGLEVLNHEGGYLHDELAIRFTPPYGAIAGRVVDAGDGSPIAGAEVIRSDGFGAVTDDQGEFGWSDAMAGFYTVTARAVGYNSVSSDTFEVADRETTGVEVALTHPEVVLDQDRIHLVMDRNRHSEGEFWVANHGNGPLNFSIRPWAPLRDEPGDILFDWDLTGLLGDARIQCVATDGELFYVAGGNNQDNPNRVYVIGLDGELVDAFDQPVETPSILGFSGLAWDGEALYGVDNHEVVAFDSHGEVLGRFECPVFRGYLAYDPEADLFWTAGIISNIYAFNRQGRVVRVLESNLRKYGIAWRSDDPDGYGLYVLHHVPAQGGQEERNAVLSKVHPRTGAAMPVMDLDTGIGDAGTGLALSNDFNALLWLGLMLVDNDGADRVVGFELNLNHEWVVPEPRTGSLAAGASMPVRLAVSSWEMEPGEYRLNLLVEPDVGGASGVVALDVTLTSRPVDDLKYYDFYPNDAVHEFVLSGAEVSGQEAMEGDEIGVFTSEGVCVGGVRWQGAPTTAPAYRDDPATGEVDGFDEGTLFHFRIWDSDLGGDYRAVFTRTEGDSLFRVGGRTVGTLNAPLPHFYRFNITAVRHRFIVTSLVFGEEVAVWGDEIGVWTALGRCVGGGVWQGDTTVIPAYGDIVGTDPVEGFSRGERFTVRVWHHFGGDFDFAADYVIVSGDTTFRGGGVTYLAIAGPRVSVLDGGSPLSTTLDIERVIPNPFNRRAEVVFTMPGDGWGRMEMFDLVGRRILTVAEGSFRAGRQRAAIDAAGLAAGVYFLRLESFGHRRIAKLTVLP